MPNIVWPPIEWSVPYTDGRAIIVGFDSGHEWMLQWWYGHYKKHNNYAVYFADFGMSAACQEWCRKNGALIDLRFQCGKCNWFKKPFAILACKHSKIMWMDLDCEVRSCLSLLFEYADRGLAVTADPHNPWVKTKDVVASGVVVVKHGNPIIQQWARSCTATTLRGDQEVLNQVIQSQRDKVVIMPRECQWLRLDGDNPKALIMHWTGPAGKKYIAGQMGANKVHVISPKIQTGRIRQIKRIRPARSVRSVRPMHGR